MRKPQHQSTSSAIADGEDEELYTILHSLHSYIDIVVMKQEREKQTKKELNDQIDMFGDEISRMQDRLTEQIQMVFLFNTQDTIII